MTEKLLFELADMQIWQRGERYFVRYDAGTHQIVMREDEISEAEAEEAMKSSVSAVKMLQELQKKLINQGIDPYASNL